MKCVKFPKILQFRNTVESVRRRLTFIGLDDKGEPMYDVNKKLDPITFKGTVKLHGTNAGVSYNNQDGIYTQSRNGAFSLSKEDSHMGFTKFVIEREDVFKSFFEQIKTENNIDTSTFTISIYGEWCGSGIQSKVAISKIQKSLFIFGVKISNPKDEDFRSYWVDYTNYSNEDERIYNIDSFGTYEIDIDFTDPKASQDKLSEITLNIENECPVGKHFGEIGTGEGVVWTAYIDGHRECFKVKGEKHSNTKVKKLAEVDIEKLKSIEEFVDYSVTRNRIEQGLQEVFGTPDKYDIKKTGDFVRWIVNDVESEEFDTLEKNGLDIQDVRKYISKRASKYFMEELDKKVFG